MKANSTPETKAYVFEFTAPVGVRGTTVRAVDYRCRSSTPALNAFSLLLRTCEVCFVLRKRHDRIG
jgi:hypothetical protein